MSSLDETEIFKISKASEKHLPKRAPSPMVRIPVSPARNTPAKNTPTKNTGNRLESMRAKKATHSRDKMAYNR